MQRIQYAVAAAMVVLTLPAITPAFADEPSGTAIAVIQSTQAVGASGDRVLVEQGDVYSGDKIVTGPIGQAQIKFRDNTKLVVGPNSTMSIDSFVYSGKSAQTFSIDAVKGTFRFITGISHKDAYSIATPTAVIAVRGTEFDFHVDWSGGLTEVVMFGGVTQICPKTLPDGSPNLHHEGCTLARQACGMTLVPSGGDTISQLHASEQRNQLINTDFRYIRNQSGLDPQFQVNLTSCGAPANFLNVPPPPPPGHSATPPPPPPVSE